VGAIVEFGEQDDLKAVLVRYDQLCEELEIDACERSVGREIVGVFQSSLSECAAAGNAARFEKVVGRGSKSLRITAQTGFRPSRLCTLLSKLFRR
jgi:hypothetical protein